MPLSPKDLPETKRSYGLVAIAVPLEAVAGPLFAKRGLLNGRMAVDWSAIVGSVLASRTLPLRCSFPQGRREEGVLHIKVDASAFATELTHLEPLVIERINRYFGWKAIVRLRLIHGPLPERRQAAPLAATSGPPLERPQQAWLQETLSPLPDSPLREVLEQLGRRIAENSKPAKETP